MKRHFVILSILILAIVSCMADDTSETTQQEKPKQGWKYESTLKGTGNITSYSDWQAGGEDSIAIGGQFGFGARYIREKSDWGNTLKAEYSMTKIEKESYRKAADVLSLESLYKYNFNSVLGSYARAAGNTSMDKSWLYFDSPTDVIYRDGKMPSRYGISKIKTSDSFEPINLDEGAGITLQVWKDAEDTHHVSFLTGLAGRQFIATDYYVKDDDDTTPETEMKRVDDYSELGLEAGMEIKAAFRDSIAFLSKALGFYGFDQSSYRATWDTSLNITLTKNLGVSIAVSMLYDELVFDDVQWKTNTLLMFTYTLL